jgi:yecA family protein
VDIDELDLFLKKHKAFPIIKLDGLLTAVVSSPIKITTKQWTESAQIDKINFESTEESRKIIALVMTLYNYIAKDLEAENYIPLINVSPARPWEWVLSDSIMWSRGYLQGAHLWPDNLIQVHGHNIVHFLQPINILANKTNNMMSDYNQIDNDNIESLPWNATSIYKFWKQHLEVYH